MDEYKKFQEDVIFTRGFTAQEMDKLRKVFPRPMYEPNKQSIEKIMYIEGQQDILRWIEANLLVKGGF